MTDSATDDAGMRQAKAQFTAAAQAVLDGDPEAARLCTEALAEIEAAQQSATKEQQQ